MGITFGVLQRFLPRVLLEKVFPDSQHCKDHLGLRDLSRVFSSWHIVIDCTVAAACAVLSVSAPESPHALGNSFDATRRLKCLGLGWRSSWDEQSQQYG